MTAPIPPRTKRTLRVSTWLGLAVSGILLLIATVTTGISGFLIWMGVIAVATGVYTIALRRPSWMRLGSRGIGVAVVIGGVIFLMIGGSVTPRPALDDDYVAEDSAPAAIADVPSDPEPAATPEPVAQVQMARVLHATAARAFSLLSGRGFDVVFEDSHGKTVRKLSGWKVVSQSPKAGISADEGSTVILVVKKPTPKPVHHPPAPVKIVGPPAGVTALCRDGSYSYAAHHQGACSHHGGVAQFYR